MRDGQTRAIPRPREGRGLSEFLAEWQPTIVILTGWARGTEYALDRPRITLGRGPGVDLAFDDAAMSRHHAVVEFTDSGFRIRDLGSTNGVRVNGAPVQMSELKHADRFELGAHEFEFVLAERQRQPRTWLLPES